MKLRYVLMLIISAAVFTGCSDDDSDDGVTSPTSGETVSGTYSVSNVMVHSGGDCSADDGISGLCFPDVGTPEAECPIGNCNCTEVMDGVTTEEDCDAVDGDWDDSQECEQDCDATTETECLAADGDWYSGGFCMDENGDGIEGIDTESDCTGENQWIILGWNLLTAWFSDSFTFSEDGTFTMSDMSGTWALDGATLTMTDSDGDVNTGTVSGDTITIEMTDEVIGEADCIAMTLIK